MSEIHSKFNACMHREYCKQIEKQRDELLAALEEITNVFATIGMTAGYYDDELNALQKGLSAIASVKGGA